MERLRQLSRDLSLMKIAPAVYAKAPMILVAFILFFRFATFYALERINYATR